MSVVVETPHEHRHASRRDTAALLVGAAALIVAIAVVVYVIWHLVATVHAVPFDADGVRCYTLADTTSCLKTAEPPR
jgi:cobalamin biosynthesis protein CobD/CbiB